MAASYRFLILLQHVCVFPTEVGTFESNAGEKHGDTTTRSVEGDPRSGLFKKELEPLHADGGFVGHLS